MHIYIYIYLHSSIYIPQHMWRSWFYSDACTFHAHVCACVCLGRHGGGIWSHVAEISVRYWRPGKKCIMHTHMDGHARLHAHIYVPTYIISSGHQYLSKTRCNMRWTPLERMYAMTDRWKEHPVRGINVNWKSGKSSDSKRLVVEIWVTDMPTTRRFDFDVFPPFYRTLMSQTILFA